MADFDQLYGSSDLPASPDLDGISAEEQAEVSSKPLEVLAQESGGDDTQEASSANAEIAEETGGEEVEDVNSDAEDEPAVPPKPAGKQYTFKVGDKDVALDEGAVIEHKVDGKLEKIAVKDLISQYAGKVAIDRRFSELDRERKKEAARIGEFESTRTRHATLIKDMHANVSQGKIFHAVANMLEMSGIKDDPRKFVGAMRAGMLEQAKALANMTDEQRAVFEQKEQNEFLQDRYDRLMKQRETEQAQVAFQGRVAKALESVNASMEEYVEMKSWLENDYKEKGRDTASLTPEFISGRIQDRKYYETARDALNEVSPDLIKDEKNWDQAVFLLRQYPSWTKEDLRDVFKQAVDTKRGASVSKKVAKAPVATVVAAASNAKTAPATAKSKLRELRASQDPKAYAQLPPEAFKPW